MAPLILNCRAGCMYSYKSAIWPFKQPNGNQTILVSSRNGYYIRVRIMDYNSAYILPCCTESGSSRDTEHTRTSLDDIQKAGRFIGHNGGAFGPKGWGEQRVGGG